MPELPEVEALRHFLADHCLGQTVRRTELPGFACLKTVAIPLTALHGQTVDQVARRGKFLGLRAGGVWLVCHLARAGWLTWYDQLPLAPVKPGRGPVALRLGFDSGAGFALTEAGTQKRLAVYVVSALDQVPGIASLGPDPLGDGFTQAALDQILDRAGRAQIKGVLRDQAIIAGIGNAYSDDILHHARLSPFKPAGSLTATERAGLYAAIRDELAQAVARSAGVAARHLKDDKRAALRVHGRAGLPCPVCGTTIAEVSFADSALQYCPACQTGGRLLADRRLSRLLK